MKKGNQEAKVRELMAKGFSKTKCVQALKDAGNNTALALRILERQKQSESSPAGPSQATEATHRNSNPRSGGSAQPMTGIAASIPSLYRAPKTSTAFQTTEAQKKLQRQRERRHPCIVQYGSCQYGDCCLLRDFPGDVCVQYCHGSCIYGAACWHRHVVDGVDVRAVLRDAQDTQDAEAATLLQHHDGAMYRDVEGSADAKVQVAERVVDGAASSSATAEESSASPWADSSQHTDAAAPLIHSQNHADPFRLREAAGGEDEVESYGARDGEEDIREGFNRADDTSVHHPTPFLDVARVGGDAASAAQAPRVNNRYAKSTPAPATAPALGRRRHPCLAQYGSCKFGDACLHADRDADVCVHFLNGHCRYSAAECRYRHESAEEYQQALRARVGLDARAEHENGNTRCSGRGSSKAGQAAPQTKSRLQGAGMEIVNHNRKGRSGSCSRTGAVTASPAGADADADAAAVAVAVHGSQLPSFEDLNALTAAMSKSSSAQDVAEHGHRDDAVGDAERCVFFALVEAYPLVEPAVLLQTLRLCGGDAVKTSDMISSFDDALSLQEVDSLAAALASAAAEEAAEREAAQTASQEARTMARHNSLLTLIMLFPSMEVSAVEAVLSQQKDDFAAAYNVLLCAQEKMARAALWNGSSATLSPADQLRVEKLYAMFPGLHQEIVRSAFCASGHDWSATTTALNELTKELLSLEAVELPAKPVVWHPHASPRTESAPTGDDPQPRGQRETQGRFHSGGGGQSMCPLAVQETSEEAYEAYRAAEKEILGYGDWRQVRQQAYLINTQRLRVLGQASAAFHQGDGRTAKLLSREGHRMAVEYNRLNRMAMLALEQERLRSDAVSTLDLHGFHTAEVHDVVVRRVEVCQRKRIGQLRIVVGEGLHSKRGHRSLYTTLMEELRTDPYLKLATKVKSIKAGYVDVTVQLPARDA